MDGDDAFGMVCRYSTFGVQRTGSAANETVKHWLSDELTERGADITLQHYRYQHFEQAVSVFANGRELEAMALYYCAGGEFELTNPAVEAVDAHVDEPDIDCAINNAVTDAKAKGHDGLLLATRCPTGDLCAINRAPGDRHEFPIILIAGGEFDRVRGAELRVCFSASTRPAEASNIVARLPHPVACPSAVSPIVVTTPISGWFTCAGERGCGLTVAIAVATRLSETHPVELLLATGHELGFAGGYDLAEHFTGTPAGIMHLGSCIANKEADLVSICSADVSTTGRIASALAPLNVRPMVPARPSSDDEWIGESKCWAVYDRPMLSVAGQAVHFHTPGDVPDAVTSAELLDKAINAIGLAATELAECVRP